MTQKHNYDEDERAALDALTPQQRGFVLHYIENGSPKNAYIANYKVDPNNKRLAQKAHDMIKKNKKIAAAIEALRRGIEQRTDVTLDALVHELVDIVNDSKEIRKASHSLALTGDMTDREVTRRLDKLTALDSSTASISAIKQISKMLGFEMPKKVEQTNNLIQINVIRPDSAEH